MTLGLQCGSARCLVIFGAIRCAGMGGGEPADRPAWRADVVGPTADALGLERTARIAVSSRPLFCPGDRAGSGVYQPTARPQLLSACPAPITAPAAGGSPRARRA